MANLFANAKQTAKPKAAKKEKPEFKLDKTYRAKIKRFNELKAEIESSKAALSLLESDLKDQGREHFMDLYLKTTVRPENFKLVGEEMVANKLEVEKVMFILMDKYLKVDESKEATLRAFFGLNEDGKGVDAAKLKKFNSIFDEKTVYSFNPEVLERNQEAISAAITNSKKISAEDKENLLVVTSEKSIKKGLIDQLMTYENPKMLFSLIEPIAQLKTVGEND